MADGRMAAVHRSGPLQHDLLCNKMRWPGVASGGREVPHVQALARGQRLLDTGVYREIVPKGKIVYTDNFSDAEGNPVPASYYGMQGDWPPEMMVTVTFVEDGGRTTMTLRHDGLPPESISDCEAGWAGSFDKLAASVG